MLLVFLNFISLSYISEPVKSPVVHKREQSEEPDQQSADGTALNSHSR